HQPVLRAEQPQGGVVMELWQEPLDRDAGVDDDDHRARSRRISTALSLNRRRRNIARTRSIRASTSAGLAAEACSRTSLSSAWSERRKRGAVEPPLGVPEPGAPEGLRAVEEALLHLDADGDQGTLVVGPQRLEDLVVADDPCAPVHTERLLAARDEEDRPDVRVLEEVPHPVQSPVARSVRDHEVAVVEDADEPRRGALRRDVAPPLGARRGQEEEGRPRDESAAVLVEDGDVLLDRPVARRAQQVP